MRRKAFSRRFSQSHAAQERCCDWHGGTDPTRQVRERDVPSAIAVGGGTKRPNPTLYGFSSDQLSLPVITVIATPRCQSGHDFLPLLRPAHTKTRLAAPISVRRHSPEATPTRLTYVHLHLQMRSFSIQAHVHRQRLDDNRTTAFR